ncbi:hypothetical protein MBM_01903 [Drepanopeziza brunnea f. sp. 'multigermtubi' MB_m1]|uniref:Uncharacterized protein n=1 Tax=Marssonina brunnea f. sp. multigermtubi (strain MB_m1) TaxID=1072389 RepID=K1X405_MARBU|nr:uncharacterized protein MBM_01903 [Drepanopeziza brunnea f. sp. 'multigermtubi' MB_m1]EKD19951.1 hypothetical protein MBM_01903 [Drepanopeziza brunnea f. sp. 'multigermtubi' MB_m1]
MIINKLKVLEVFIVVYTDSYSLYECFIKLGTIKKKRLMIDIIALKQSYERRELAEPTYVSKDLTTPRMQPLAIRIKSYFNRDYYNYDTSVIRCLRYAKGSYNNCTVAFAAANTAFDNFLALNAALSRSAASSPGGLASRTLALAALVAFVAFVALVALAAFVASVALIIVALFALVVALTAFATALAVIITFAKRRAKVKRLLKALIDLLL